MRLNVGGEKEMRATICKTEYMTNPRGIDTPSQRLSWNCEEGKKQSAYQIQMYCKDTLIFDTNKVETDDMHCLVAPPIHSRDRIFWKIRLWDETDQCGPWSALNWYEIGLLQKGDWSARFITLKNEEVVDGSDPINSMAKKAWDERKHKKDEVFTPHKPATYFRKKFSLKLGQKANLYASAYGIYEAYINGIRVGDQVLAPGSSNYQFEVKYQIYDVTSLLKEGENEIELILGDGWYLSTSGVDGDRFLYGEKTAILAQLEVDGKIVEKTDETWRACSFGPVRQNDLQQGEVYDAMLEGYDEEDALWHDVSGLEAMPNLVAEDMVPVKEQECFPGTIIKTPKGETVLDFGQNMAGYVSFRINGKKGKTITLIHGESLDGDGNFTTENFQDRKRHKEGGTYQMIHYTCKDGINVYKPRFTIMGFRYVKVDTELDLTDATFMAHAVYSDMKEQVSFICGNDLVNQLVKNAMWSQKGNFCDIPTDCPTRERAGWTGDAGLYVNTGLQLMDSITVYRHWLKQCRYGQYKDGKIANIAPPNNRPGFMSRLLSGSVGWGDACILVPMALYQMTGDLRFLEENYEMMKRWYGFLEQTAKKGTLKKLFKKYKNRNYTIASGIHFGEWCEPGRSAMESMRSGNYDVATAYFSHSGFLLSEIATILGFREDANHYEQCARLAKQAFIANFTVNGLIKSNRQCQFVRPLRFGLLEKEKEGQVAEELNQLVVGMDYHLNTGFLTTPDLCPVLAEHGYVETAYRLLLQESMPGWLYEVKQGATTLWETWNGIDEAGTPRESLNHYSYGAIVGWLLSGVAGISYRYDQLIIRPFPDQSLGFAEARFDSPKGEIHSGWRYEGEKLIYFGSLPANTTGILVLPDGTTKKLEPGTYSFSIT